MSIEVKVPALPESVSEATVATWHKSAGDAVKRDETIVELETDKVMLEVPASASGVLSEIRAEEGASVTADDIIAIIEEGEGGSASSSSKGASQPAPAPAPEPEPEPEPEPSAEPASEDQPQSPAVRKLLTEHGLSASNIPATGKGGRLTKADVENYLANPPESEAPAPSPAPAPAPAPTAAPAPAPTGGAREEQRVPMTRIRARIAERLVEAQSTAAMLTTFNEVDLQAVNDIRKHHKEAFEKHHEVKLGYMSFFVKAAVEALKRFPLVNASIDGNDIVYHGYYDIGIAVSSPRGLVVPIMRDADALSFAEVERKIGEFGTKARDNKLTMEDLTGGTFSITNGGIFGSMLSTPILNPPQSAILGMHGIQERPMAINGEVQIRPMMYLALTYDHRIIDGREAVLFLRSIKEFLEDPTKLLLDL
ncbi:2-oxoglutarate dehydrogenase complex dihydrolipoyllysine-residue succinyltransferase [Algiphilus sp. NNCM1]|uniref:2-oxoglutarate dehydrogenase complex dihydrolipoyllysine-residue succinyltransferase n=1 Tax=Algiphilus sp. TaxID=1872431 RepID=UPI001CA650E5|nr:2-oxoglutarate dehydrogenase complex dihydrolipoyllysine-residue succinyltransferase [Algiphilus sp.]MBY8965172.1 2-oxoglutarate dehydrogenase complex dihydrolipoyllysine-residue succinyltransferase [Algiphilus acroporae]MCI5104926.1 2-oxoglutarate dehydrogenase complex dihydrolipoyllysine-residue succinyltransferase [Algiphilus sp.]